MPLQRGLSCLWGFVWSFCLEGFVRGGFCLEGFVRGGFCLEGFVRGGFCLEGFVRGGFCLEGFVWDGFCLEGFFRGGFCLEGFVRVVFVWKVLFGWFCPSSLLSEYIRYNRKLNITFNFRFHLYEQN